MKQKDYALIMIVVFISVVVALVVSRWIFASPHNRQQTAEVVDKISPDFPLPSSKYFNADSVNPTQRIEIGKQQNPNPFNSKPQ